MSKALITEQTLTDIANLIRGKAEETENLTPSEIKNKIKTFFAPDNFLCVYDFSDYLDEIDIYVDMQKYIPSDPNSTTSNNYCYMYNTFCNCTPAKKVNLIFDRYYKNHGEGFGFPYLNFTFAKSNITNASIWTKTPGGQPIYKYIFYKCSKLKEVKFYNGNNKQEYCFMSTSSEGIFQESSVENVIGMKSIPSFCFKKCTNLKNEAFANFNSDNSGGGGIGSYAFDGCTGLTNINLQHLLRTSLNIQYGVFQNCTNLKSIYLGPVQSASSKYNFYGSGIFSNDQNIEALIINSDTRAILDSTAFSNCSIKSGGTGYVYVPDALVDSYKSATNWVTIASQIRPISELPQEYKTIYNL